jgi:hypothetical protein
MSTWTMTTGITSTTVEIPASRLQSASCSSFSPARNC